MNFNNILIQEGGNKPQIEILKGISHVFKDYSDLDFYLNPIYGFVIEELEAIKNYKLFGNPSDPVFRLINLLFNQINPNEIIPTNKIFNWNTQVMAHIIGVLYLNFVENKFILNENKKTQEKQKKELKEKIKDNELLDFVFNIETESKYIREQYNISEKITKKELKKTYEDIIKKLINIFIDARNNEEKLREMFYVLLNIVWWKSINRNGIDSYYKILTMVIEKEEKYKGIIFNTTTNSENETPFEKTLIEIFNTKNSDIPLQSQKYCVYNGNKFADCGETSLRNFLQLISYDKTNKKFDTGVFYKMFEESKSEEKTQRFNLLIKFFEDFNTPKEQNDDNFKDENGLTVRDRWAEIVSNIPGVKYLKENTSEINSGKNDEGELNMLSVIKYLFPKIDNWESFNELKIVEIEEVNLDDLGIGEIFFLINNKKYKWDFMDSHYDLQMIEQYQEDQKIDIPYDKLDYYEKRIIFYYTQENLTRGLITQPIFPNWFMYINLNNIILEILIGFYENINDIVYLKMINFILKNPTNKFKMNLDKIISILNNGDIDITKYINKENTSFYQLLDFFSNLDNNINEILDLNDNIFAQFIIITNYEWIKPYVEKIKILRLNEHRQTLPRDFLKKFVNLEELHLGNAFIKLELDTFENNTKLIKLHMGNNFNQPLIYPYDKFLISPDESDLIKTPFENLVNLKILDLGNVFNQILGNGLFHLNNLEELYFGNSFNQKIFDIDFYNNKNLKKIYFGNSFNSSVFNLGELSNLRVIKLGNMFNKPISGLYNCKNLEKIIFGSDFNISLDFSLENFNNLKTIIFGEKFNQKIEYTFSSNNKSLEELRFGNDFNQSLNDGYGLNKLKNLKILSFGKEFNQPLEKSFENLENLEELHFGKKFDQPLQDSLKNLKNLKKLYFGERFDQPLYDSLKNLINLNTLSFGKNFNQYFGESLKYLRNLEYLYINNIGYNQRIKGLDAPSDGALFPLQKLKEVYIYNTNLIPGYIKSRIERNKSEEKKFYNKYLKYKTKYLKLKSMIN